MFVESALKLEEELQLDCHFFVLSCRCTRFHNKVTHARDWTNFQSSTDLLHIKKQRRPRTCRVSGEGVSPMTFRKGVVRLALESYLPRSSRALKKSARGGVLSCVVSGTPETRQDPSGWKHA